MGSVPDAAEKGDVEASHHTPQLYCSSLLVK